MCRYVFFDYVAAVSHFGFGGRFDPENGKALLTLSSELRFPVLEQTLAELFRVEREFLESHTLIPLLYLPRAYAVGGRVRDLRQSTDGTPLLAGAALQDAP